MPKVHCSYNLHIRFDLNFSQTILAQVDRDSCIVRLVEIMDDVFSFVKEAEPMKKIESHGPIIELMSQQATECAYFIRDYAMNKSLCRSSPTLHVGRCCMLYQGNEPSKIVSCRTLIARSNSTRTSSTNSSQLFKVVPFFRQRSSSPACSAISIVLVRDLIYHVLPPQLISIKPRVSTSMTYPMPMVHVLTPPRDVFLGPAI